MKATKQNGDWRSLNLYTEFCVKSKCSCVADCSFFSIEIPIVFVPFSTAVLGDNITFDHMTGYTYQDTILQHWKHLQYGKVS